MKFQKTQIFLFLFSNFLRCIESTEWFTKINSNDGIVFYQDKTIVLDEFSTPSKLKCIQTCLSFDSSCQFFKHNKKEICTIFISIEKDFFYGKTNIYLREKKLPRVHFLNNSFLDQSELVRLSQTSIDLFRSGLSQIVPYAFELCNRVETLNLSFNNLTKIYSKSFYGMTKLKRLIMSFNQISLLESNVFQDLPALYILELNNNLIANIDENLFNNLQELEMIILNSNQIETLVNYTFKNLIKLKRINLASNKLKSIDLIFLNLDQFYLLDVSFNQINTIHNDTFKALRKIQEIYLGNNKISEINSEIFKGLENLKILRLGMNEINKINSNFSLDLSNLTDLEFSYNNLSFIESNFFQGFVKLVDLRLYACNIKSINLDSLVKLNYLNLGFNQIQYFSQNLSSLTILLLNSNPLGNLSYPLITSQNSSLRDLDISDCLLKSIDFNYLRSLSLLKILRISGNSIPFNNQSFTGFKSLEQIFLDKTEVDIYKNIFTNITLSIKT
ncbi:unnamed protein product [Brachionus calyciflorus]|uniref:Uncharacterized protein n=1 Tax=Brachionus calyciflorus TaxID=104777 RepID=A0A814A795_9BILA|nr:unnamed protein product [Brachionus calyciflorus]